LIDGDSAAATMAATMKPAAPCDGAVTMNVGGSSSLRASVRGSGVLIVGEQHHADEQEQHELGEHEEAAQHEPRDASREERADNSRCTRN
jgi:hypothetical protein